MKFTNFLLCLLLLPNTYAGNENNENKKPVPNVTLALGGTVAVAAGKNLLAGTAAQTAACAAGPAAMGGGAAPIAAGGGAGAKALMFGLTGTKCLALAGGAFVAVAMVYGGYKIYKYYYPSGSGTKNAQPIVQEVKEVKTSQEAKKVLQDMAAQNPEMQQQINDLIKNIEELKASGAADKAQWVTKEAQWASDRKTFTEQLEALQQHNVSLQQIIQGLRRENVTLKNPYNAWIRETFIDMLTPEEKPDFIIANNILKGALQIINSLLQVHGEDVLAVWGTFITEISPDEDRYPFFHTIHKPLFQGIIHLQNEPFKKKTLEAMVTKVSASPIDEDFCKNVFRTSRNANNRSPIFPFPLQANDDTRTALLAATYNPDIATKAVHMIFHHVNCLTWIQRLTGPSGINVTHWLDAIVRQDALQAPASLVTINGEVFERAY